MSRAVVVAVVIVALAVIGALVVLSVNPPETRAALRGLARDGLDVATAEPSAEADVSLDCGLYLVRVVREDRGSVEGARVLALGPAYEEEAQADASGDARLRCPPAGSYVFAAVPGMPVVGSPVQSKQDGQVLLVPAGSMLAGRVLVSGGRLPKYLQLNLPAGSELDAVPAEWWDSLMAYRVLREIVIAPVAEDGSFRFAGLRPGDGYEIGLPFQAYTFWGSEETSVLAAVPKESLVLRLRALPVIEGRVVRPGGTPVAGATVLLRSYPAEKADEDGRFSLPITKGVFAPFLLTVADERGRGSRTLELRDPGPEGFTLGDIALRPVSGAVLVVLDEARNPLRGAVARAVAPGAEIAGPADDHGRIEVASAGEPYHVTAWGHEVAELEVPDVPGPVEVRLARTTILRIRVLGEAPGAVVRLQSEAILLRPDSWKDSELLAAARNTVPHGMARIRPGSSLWFEPQALIALSGIGPGLPFRVELVDPLGFPHETHEITMKPAEEREVTLTTQRPYRSVKGVVRDDNGEPVSGALVQLAPPGIGGVTRPRSQRTDENGRFAFPGVIASDVRLCVDADSLVPWAQDNMKLPPRGTDLEIRLSRGRSVRVVVIDEIGASLMAYVFVDLGPYVGDRSVMHRRIGLERPAGTYEIRGLPEADIDVTVSRSRASKTVRVGVHDAEVRVVLGAR